jgi:hypothetical protein
MRSMISCWKVGSLQVRRGTSCGAVASAGAVVVAVAAVSAVAVAVVVVSVVISVGAAVVVVLAVAGLLRWKVCAYCFQYGGSAPAGEDRAARPTDDRASTTGRIFFKWTPN